MVVGIDKLQEYFSGHEEMYAVIGGTACDLIFDEVGLEFRATKDIDMVLCIEVIDIIQADLRRFVHLMEEDKTFNPRTFNVQMSPVEGIAFLRSAYQLA